MKSFKDWVAKTVILSIDESKALVKVSERWPFGDLIPAIILSIVINLWRPSQGETVLSDDGEAELFVGHGQEFVNERFRTLISKCVPALKSYRPERRPPVFDSEGNLVKKGGVPKPSVSEGQPILDQHGELVIAVRATDHNGEPSPDPKKWLAWVLTHTGRKYWVQDGWLRRYGLLVELDWWGEVEVEARPQDEGEGHVGGTVTRKRHKVVKEVVYHPSLFNQEELDELRSILVATQVAEEEGVIKRKAITMREDGTIELGLLPYGPTVTDGRDLYQEIHDSSSDDTRTALKAILEQERTDTLPWLQHEYDGGPNERHLFQIDDHPGYVEGVPALPKPSEEDNKEWRRPKYRLGTDILLAKTLEDGWLRMLREDNILTFASGETEIDEDYPKRHVCVRARQPFINKRGTRRSYFRWGNVFDSGDILKVNGVGAIKQVNLSLAIEVEAVLRGVIEAGDFKFVLIRRNDEHSKTKVHKCHRYQCPQSEHAFTDKGYTHVCGVSGEEYWMVKAKVIVDREHFEFLNLPKEAEFVVAEIYGSMVGELMRLAPESFGKQVRGDEALDRFVPYVYKRPDSDEEEEVVEEEVLRISGPDPRFEMIMGIQERARQASNLKGRIRARLRELNPALLREPSDGPTTRF